jgi:hypothetical protein
LLGGTVGVAMATRANKLGDGGISRAMNAMVIMAASLILLLMCLAYQLFLHINITWSIPVIIKITIRMVRGSIAYFFLQRRAVIGQ